MYQTILIDPPWLERGGGQIQRGADRHYALLSTPDIIKTIYASGMFKAAQDAHLYLWVTNNFLPDGITVVKALGFRYVTMITWYKDRIGLGQYFRGCTEHMLFAVKGRLRASEQGVTGFQAARTEHSRKPEKAYQMIEKVSPSPRLEMFARRKREGWDVWGNEIQEDLFTAQAAISAAKGEA